MSGRRGGLPPELERLWLELPCVSAIGELLERFALLEGARTIKRAASAPSSRGFVEPDSRGTIAAVEKVDRRSQSRASQRRQLISRKGKVPTS